MNWSDFFFFSWLVSEDENEQLCRENQELRHELDGQRQEESNYDDYYEDSFDEDQYYDDREGE